MKLGIQHNAFAPMPETPDPSYDELRSVLAIAFERCAKGKGRTHSNSEDLKNDDFWTLMRVMHGSSVLREAPELSMPLGQALKDILEYMKSGSAIKLMDAVVYLSLAYMVDARTRMQKFDNSTAGSDASVAQSAERPNSKSADAGSTPAAGFRPFGYAADSEFDRFLKETLGVK